MNMPVWKCKTCGCFWRDNLDETVSLLNAEQKSCNSCEHTPTREACEIHWLQVESATPLNAEAGAVDDASSVGAQNFDLRRELLSLQQSLETVKGERDHWKRIAEDWRAELLTEIRKSKALTKELDQPIRWRRLQCGACGVVYRSVVGVLRRESALLRERPQEPTKDILARTGEASTATGGAATASTNGKD